NNQDSIIGVINMDAIAWDGDGDSLARVHTRNIANSVNLSTIAVSMNTTHNIGLNLEVNNPGATYSDHASFWNHDFSAILIIEDFDNDGNPHYHTVTDRVEYFDTLYFEKLSKLSFATAATVAVPLSGNVSVQDAQSELFEVYPNPTEGFITIDGIDSFENQNGIEVVDMYGRTVFKSKLRTSEFRIDTKEWSSGSYFLRIEDSEENSLYSRTILKR
ncbi:MAG: T9SS type A sorting domain-containing protein, partial [Flavobacteriales bacterium]|nr:T9SS type A sorting domain-containing protein [Flavobacteriales bacterium]